MTGLSLSLRLNPLHKPAFVDEDPPPHSTDHFIESITLSIENQITESPLCWPFMAKIPLGNGDIGVFF